MYRLIMNKVLGKILGDPSGVIWRRKWQPTPVFLPGESHGQKSLEDYSPWGHKKSDTTERLTHKGEAIVKELPHFPSGAPLSPASVDMPQGQGL